MDETRLLLSRLDDLIYKYYCGEVEGFGFLNELEVSVAHNYLKNQNIEHIFYGGYPSATRMFLYLESELTEYSDIVPLMIKVKGDNNHTHRDFLGSLMGLGINRECVGDILLKDGYAVAFVKAEISEYIMQNLDSVGRSKVEVQFFGGDLSTFSPELSETEIIVTSMRIDNFITSVSNCSRQKAAELIKADYVFVNYSCIDKVSKNLNFGDTVSIRGVGKFKIGEILRKTKSGRLVLSVLQYK